MYLFFDIDGTLTNRSTGQIVPSAKLTIKKLIHNGHVVSIVTGRAHYKAVGIAQELGIRYIISNGGAALSIDGRVVYNKPLDRDKSIQLCNEAHNLGYGVLVANEDNENVIMFDRRFIEQVGKRKEPTHYIFKEKGSFEEIDSFYKIYLSVLKHEEHQLTLLDSLPHLRFTGDYLMYQHDKKDQGIVEMIKYIGGNLDEIVVFGDDVNDLVMFKKEWCCIAMGNSCPELKEKATFVTKDNVDDGIEYACQYFGWI